VLDFLVRGVARMQRTLALLGEWMTTISLLISTGTVVFGSLVGTNVRTRKINGKLVYLFWIQFTNLLDSNP
jgi:hypothetical protein